MIRKERDYMLESIDISRASDAGGLLPGHLGLRLEEEFQPLFVAHGTPDVLDRILPMGQVQKTASSLRLRLWPDKIWLNTEPSDAGPSDAGLRGIDISHGVTHFRLRGVEALHFIADYTTTDLFTAPVREARVARTKLNGYDCVLWWENTRDVHIVTDRSLAQSFADHLRELAIRRDPPDPSTHPRPTHPDAPERRG
jgi:hypothetical protein